MRALGRSIPLNLLAIDECPGVDDAVYLPDCLDAIPTVSQWGLVILTLLLLVSAKIYFGRPLLERS